MSETLEEIATRVVNQIPVGAWQYCSRPRLIGLVTEALRNERERASKIVQGLTRKQSFVASVWNGVEATKRELEILATAIREGR